MVSFACAFFLFLSTFGVVSGSVNDTNDTEVFITPSPTPVPTSDGELAVSTFTISIGIASIGDFDVDEFTLALANSMGVDISMVALSEITFEISTSYEIDAVVYTSTLKDAVVNITGASADEVSVTESLRRLAGEGVEGRRLSAGLYNVYLSIPVAKASLATAATGQLASVAGIADAVGISASLVSGGVVKIEVKAKAAVTSTSATPVAAPTADAFLQAMRAVAPNKAFTVGTVVVDTPTAGPTAAPTQGEEESGASELSAFVRLTSILVGAAALSAATL